MQNSNISSEIRFDLFEIPKKGAKPENIAKNDTK